MNERDQVPFLAAEDMPVAPPVVKVLSPQYLRHYVACPVAVEGATVTVAAASRNAFLKVMQIVSRYPGRLRRGRISPGGGLSQR